VALTQPLTLDEFLLQPEEKPALEYERGVITQKMSPMPVHGKLSLALGMRLETHGSPTQVVSAYIDTRVTWLDEGVSYVPDLVAYLVEREPTTPHGRIDRRFLVPPDLAVEVHSPGQGLDEQRARCRWYVEHGVKVALLAHPEREAIWVFRPGREIGPLTGAAVVDLAPEIPGFSFVVAELFAVFQRRPR
jgi:Uma2 family endonuclease